ncbi:MAG: 50S ribosomal protein L29 [Pseudomonadota bacterium]
MAKQKVSELRGLSLDDVIAKVKLVNDEIFKIRMQQVTGSMSNKHGIVSKRRELARLKTILNEKLGGTQ